MGLGAGRVVRTFGRRFSGRLEQARAARQPQVPAAPAFPAPTRPATFRRRPRAASLAAGTLLTDVFGLGTDARRRRKTLLGE